MAVDIQTGEDSGYEDVDCSDNGERRMESVWFRSQHLLPTGTDHQNNTRQDQMDRRRQEHLNRIKQEQIDNNRQDQLGNVVIESVKGDTNVKENIQTDKQKERFILKPKQDKSMLSSSLDKLGGRKIQQDPTGYEVVVVVNSDTEGTESKLSLVPQKRSVHFNGTPPPPPVRTEASRLAVVSDDDKRNGGTDIKLIKDIKTTDNVDKRNNKNKRNCDKVDINVIKGNSSDTKVNISNKPPLPNQDSSRLDKGLKEFKETTSKERIKLKDTPDQDLGEVERVTAVRQSTRRRPVGAGLEKSAVGGCSVSDLPTSSSNQKVNKRWETERGQYQEKVKTVREEVKETYLGPLEKTGGGMLAAPAPATRARSYDVLNNKAHYQVPENKLQQFQHLTPHQVRVQKSLEKLNVPNWYKTNVQPLSVSTSQTVPDTPKWRRGHSCSRSGWRRDSGTLSSIGGNSRPTTPADSTSREEGGLSSRSTPCPSSSYSRWSTNRLNYMGSDPKQSDPSPAHSNFSLKSYQSSTSSTAGTPTTSQPSYKQPYLGWRSQERLTSHQPFYLASPSQRLASSNNLVQRTSPRPRTDIQISRDKNPNQALHNSIKQVTEAIVDYCSPTDNGSQVNGGQVTRGQMSEGQRRRNQFNGGPVTGDQVSEGQVTRGQVSDGQVSEGSGRSRSRRSLSSKGTFQGLLDSNTTSTSPLVTKHRNNRGSSRTRGVWMESSFVAGNKVEYNGNPATVTTVVTDNGEGVTTRTLTCQVENDIF